MIDNLGAKFGYCTFSHFGSIVRTETQTDRQTDRNTDADGIDHCTKATTVGVSNKEKVTKARFPLPELTAGVVG